MNKTGHFIKFFFQILNKQNDLSLYKIILSVMKPVEILYPYISHKIKILLYNLFFMYIDRAKFITYIQTFFLQVICLGLTLFAFQTKVCINYFNMISY